MIAQGPTAQPISWELQAARDDGQWGLTLVTFGDTGGRKPLPFPVVAEGTTVRIELPLSQVPPVATALWFFGASSDLGDDQAVFDDCEPFTSTNTTAADGGAGTTVAGGLDAPFASPIARHTRSGVQGMSMWRTPRCATRVDHRVLHRGRGADGARLADALGAERVQRRRRLHGDHARTSAARPPR